MSAGPAATARSADTKEIGFPGPFFTHRREIAPRRRDWQPVQGSAEDAGRAGYLSVVMPVQGWCLAGRGGPGPSGFRSSAITGTVLECADGRRRRPRHPGRRRPRRRERPVRSPQKTTAPAAAGALTGCPQPARSPGSGRHVHRTLQPGRPPGAVNRIGAGAPTTALYRPCTSWTWPPKQQASGEFDPSRAGNPCRRS